MDIRARDYKTGRIVDIAFTSGVIDQVVEVPNEAECKDTPWVAPAFFDLQINGCLGHSFNSGELEDHEIHEVVQECHCHGIGQFCPTLITNSRQALIKGFAKLSSISEQCPDLGRAMPVYHLEGPYISPEDGPRGAHPRDHVRGPDWDEFQYFQEAAQGRIRLVTLAPEHDGALEFIEQLVKAGVVVAIGHTAANGARIRDAIRAGARLSTHLGNGAHAVLPRHDNYIWEQLAADELWVSIICDGHHLTPAVAKCILRVKTAARTILTCDASSLAGCSPGKYREWGQEIEVLPEGKVVVTSSGYLAGSGAFTDLCVGNAVKFAGVSLAEAVDMATERPRQILRLPPHRLEPGFPADFVLFDWQPGGKLRVRSMSI